MVGPLGRTTKCRGCGAEICFIKTIKGKSMPVDPMSVYFIPDAGSETFVMINGEVQHGREPERNEDQAKVWIGYRSHFATCTAADEFRKKQKSERVRR